MPKLRTRRWFGVALHSKARKVVAEALAGNDHAAFSGSGESAFGLGLRKVHPSIPPGRATDDRHCDDEDAIDHHFCVSNSTVVSGSYEVVCQALPVLESSAEEDLSVTDVNGNAMALYNMGVYVGQAAEQTDKRVRCRLGKRRL